MGTFSALSFFLNSSLLGVYVSKNNFVDTWGWGERKSTEYLVKLGYLRAPSTHVWCTSIVRLVSGYGLYSALKLRSQRLCLTSSSSKAYWGYYSSSNLWKYVPFVANKGVNVQASSLNCFISPGFTNVQDAVRLHLQSSSLVKFKLGKKKKSPVLAFTVVALKSKLRGIFSMTKVETDSPYLNATTPARVSLTEVTATSVAAMFGYARRYQRAGFIRQSLFRHFRRYFLVLGSFTCSLGIFGVLRHFRALFKVLNSPSGQAYRHPLSNAWVSDFGLELRSIARKDILNMNKDALSGLVKAHVIDNLTSQITTKMMPSATDEASVSEIVRDLTEHFWSTLRQSRRLNRYYAYLYRYTLVWEDFSFMKGSLHGFHKFKRARSIKKRRTKRLVKKTKYRFWAL